MANLAIPFQNSFVTINQYDKRFDSMFENIKKKGYSCSYFSILTCLRFLQGYFPDADTHEQNVIDSMTISCLLDVSAGLSFEDLIIGCTTYDHKQIVATTVELISTGVIGFDQMFPILNNSQEKYAVMFLKNEKYFVVMVDSEGFYIRDCHISEQVNFKTLTETCEYLTKVYQFTAQINVDGLKFDEYSSVEFLIFDQLFHSDTLTLLNSDSSVSIIEQKNQLVRQQINQTYYPIKIGTNNDNNDHNGNNDQENDLQIAIQQSIITQQIEQIDQTVANTIQDAAMEPTILVDIAAETKLAIQNLDSDNKQYQPVHDLKGDIFNVPNKVLFTMDDIKYLEKLNNELSKQNKSNGNFKEKMTNSNKITEKFDYNDFSKDALEDDDFSEMVDF